MSADNKPALVLLCQHLPHAPVNGELITTFNMMRHLAQRYRVFVATFGEDTTDDGQIEHVKSMVSGVYVVQRHRALAWLQAFPRWLSGQPASFALFRSRGLEKWLDSVETNHRPVAIVTHSSNVSAYAVDWFRRAKGENPVRVLHFADVDSEKFRAYADRAAWFMKWLVSLESRRVRREERRLTKAADAVCFVSDEEADLFRSILDANRDRVMTLPNGVDTDLFDPDSYPHSPFKSGGQALVFSGAMNYRPNIEAVTWFVREVLPGLKTSLPNVQFLIVGSKPTPEVQRLADDPSVIVTGRVDSVAAYVAHSQVAVAPLQIARGVQNKVLEAMAMAKPQVVSPGAQIGIDARPGTHLLRAESRDEWVRCCVELLTNRQRAENMGRAARELALECYSWPAQLAKLDQLLARGGNPNRIGVKT